MRDPDAAQPSNAVGSAHHGVAVAVADERARVGLRAALRGDPLLPREKPDEGARVLLVSRARPVDARGAQEALVPEGERERVRDLDGRAVRRAVLGPVEEEVAPPPAADDARSVRRRRQGQRNDVPGQLRPRRYLATGAGEELHALPDPPPYGVLVLPAETELSTAEVYRQADLMGLPRPQAELPERAAAVAAHGADLPDELVVNDLEPAARALCPAIDDALRAARDAGADRVMVCGSGPTVVGLFRRVEAARAAAVALAGRHPRPLVAEPWPARTAEAVR